jgi:hypothetical protein
VIQDLEIDLDLPPGVEAFAFGTARVTPQPHGISVLLGAMLGEAERKLVVRLRCPAGQHGETLAIETKLRWLQTVTSARSELALPACQMTFAKARECGLQARDLATAGIAALQWQAWVLHCALQQNQDGDVRSTRRFVSEQLRHLIRYCQGLPDGHQIDEALRRLLPTLATRYDPRGAKELLLASYKRGRGEIDRRRQRRDAADLFMPPQA